MSLECRFRGRRSAQSLLDQLRRACAPLGRAWLSADLVAGVALGEPRVQILWQAQYLVSLECRFCGWRSTQSLLDQLRRAWARLGRVWPSADFVAGTTLGESGVQILWEAKPPWISRGAGGRRWATRG